MNTHETIDAPATRVWLGRYSKLLVALTLFLIYMGGQVKSHEAGLSVPDWPTTYGENMFTFHYDKWVGGIWYEHTHRLVASVIGMLTIIIMVWLHIVDSRGWVRNLSKLALGAVIVQGLFGGLTVFLFLAAWTSIVHGVLAQLFLLMIILLAYAVSREWGQREKASASLEGNPVLKPACMLTGLVFLQLILGAVVRHTESGLALPDFPMMAGQWMPFFNQESVEWVNNWRFDYSLDQYFILEDVSLGQLWIHFAHRVGAVLVVVGLFVVAKRAGSVRDEHPSLRKMGIVLMALVTVQVLLGIATVLSHRVPLIASFHVVTGAATLGASWLLTLRAMPLSYWQESEEQEVVATGAETGDSVLH